MTVFQRKTVQPAIRYGPQFQCKAVSCYPSVPAPLHGNSSGSKPSAGCCGVRTGQQWGRSPLCALWADSTGDPALQTGFGMRCWRSIPSPGLPCTTWLKVGMGETGGSSTSVKLLQMLVICSHFGKQSNSSAVWGHSPLGLL